MMEKEIWSTRDGGGGGVNFPPLGRKKRSVPKLSGAMLHSLRVMTVNLALGGFLRGSLPKTGPQRFKGNLI